MPTYLGTLTLGDANSATNTIPSVAAPGPLDNVDTRTQPDTTHLKGRPLSSSHLLVLSNITSSLTRPNVLDLKLGSRLWDDDAPPTKRARLDEVAQNSTSGSLGFRVAGMRIWEGENAAEENGLEKLGSEGINGSSGQQSGTINNTSNAVSGVNGNAHGTTTSSAHFAPIQHQNGTIHYPSQHHHSHHHHPHNGHPIPHPHHHHSHSHLDPQTNMRFYNKLYGRSLTPSTLPAALRRFLHVPSAGISLDTAVTLAAAFRDEVREIRAALEREELRIISGSVLIAYEGDGVAFEKRLKEMQGGGAAGGKSDGDDGEEEEEDEAPVLYRVKLIDFAHARFTPGEGPDENVLRGVRNIERILGEVYEELVAEQGTS
jgi:inositol-polyphosphate multikinase